MWRLYVTSEIFLMLVGGAQKLQKQKDRGMPITHIKKKCEQKWPWRSQLCLSVVPFSWPLRPRIVLSLPLLPHPISLWGIAQSLYVVKYLEWWLCALFGSYLVIYSSHTHLVVCILHFHLSCTYVYTEHCIVSHVVEQCVQSLLAFSSNVRWGTFSCCPSECICSVCTSKLTRFTSLCFVSVFLNV